MAPVPQSFVSRTRTGLGALALAAALSLGGCVSESPFDDLAGAQPSGSAFSQALFKDYAYLARSYGMENAPSGTAFDAGDSMSISDLDSDVSDVANAFAAKALLAAKGEEPVPEPAPTDDQAAETLRLKLLRALSEGRTKAPDAAARAQADFDCWMLNAPVEKLAGSAAQCRGSFGASLARLERAVNIQPPAPPPAAAAKPADFTAYFDFGSAELTPQAMAVVQQAIDSARTGRQTRIAVVGHTDTVGTEAFNLELSKKRADAVKAALVRMGARADAVQVSGVGQSDLAVQTEPGVREPKNRRAVVTLIP